MARPPANGSNFAGTWGQGLLRDRRRDALLTRTAIRAGDHETELAVFGFCLGPFDTFVIWADVSLHFHLGKLAACVTD